MLHRYILAGLLWSLLAVNGVSASTGSGDDEKDAALKAFESGLALYDAGDFIKASNAFREANRHKYNWKILYNIGQCEAAAKRYGMALEAFEEYLAKSGDEISVSRRDEVLGEVARLRQMVGLLDVDAPDGAVVTVDGVTRGTAPLSGPVMVAAGMDHLVTVSLNGEQLFLQTLKLTGGQEKNINAAKGSIEENVVDADSHSTETTTTPEADTASPRGESSGKGLRLAGWIVFGTGTAAAIGGLVTGAVGFSKATKLKDEFGTTVPSGKADELNRYQNMSLASDILMSVGAGVATAGIVMLIIHRKKFKASESIAIAPCFSTAFAGAQLAGRF